MKRLKSILCGMLTISPSKLLFFSERLGIVAQLSLKLNVIPLFALATDFRIMFELSKNFFISC